MWRAPLFAGFPITPSTKWLETVAAHLARDTRGLRRLKLLEAEHAVADYLAGAAASCRDLVFATATSSVGLDHMTETTRSLGASGLGNVVIVNVYRATANYPLCIEGDPSDALAHRDAVSAQRPLGVVGAAAVGNLQTLITSESVGNPARNAEQTSSASSL